MVDPASVAGAACACTGGGVSVASVCHLAWGQVLARLTGREEVVFGTVLFGRMQAGAGADQAVGLFINTLPLRVTIDGRSVQEGLRQTHERLGELLEHEHASLVLAQRCSGAEPCAVVHYAAELPVHSRGGDGRADGACV